MLFKYILKKNVLWFYLNTDNKNNKIKIMQTEKNITNFTDDYWSMWAWAVVIALFEITSSNISSTYC